MDNTSIHLLGLWYILFTNMFGIVHIYMGFEISFIIDASTQHTDNSYEHIILKDLLFRGSRLRY